MHTNSEMLAPRVEGPQASQFNGVDSSEGLEAVTQSRRVAETVSSDSGVYNSVSEAAHSVGAFWLTKRRDGRSANWMIARWQGRNRSVVYQSCRTTDVGKAITRLSAFAAANPDGEITTPARKSNLVYFVRAETGQIKIGIARDVELRLAGLRTMSPVPLVLLAVTDGGQATEFAYHQRFAEHRLHGEWFSPHPDILAEIERLSA